MAYPAGNSPNANAGRWEPVSKLAGCLSFDPKSVFSRVCGFFLGNGMVFDPSLASERRRGVVQAFTGYVLVSKPILKQT